MTLITMPMRDKWCSTPPSNLKGMILINLTVTTHYIPDCVSFQPKIVFFSLFISCRAGEWEGRLSECWNAIMKAVNGNHKFRVLHLNKGKSILDNYRAPLEDLLDSTAPAICSLNEANIIINGDLHSKGVLDYKCEVAAPAPGQNMSRVCIFLKNNVNYQRRRDI